MMCYLDRTFCTFNILCQKASTCERVLTDKIKADADKWWGKEGAPICVYSEFPPCFVPFFSKENTNEN